MIKLPEKSKSVLLHLFQHLDFSQTEQTKLLNKFETTLFNQFSANVIQKIPPHERKSIANIIKAATKKSKEADNIDNSKLKEKFKYWFNEKELRTLFQKTADKLFEELLQRLYQNANEKQKQKLQKSFKKQALGIQ